MEHTSEPVTVVARAFDVLEELARSGAGRSFTELCELTGIPKATMHRLLHTMQGRRYVTQEMGTGQYSVGVRCFELGSMWAQKLDLRAVAAPLLLTLNEESRETVHLGVYEHGDVVYIERLESPQQVIAKSYVGRRCTATSVATGRVLLAHSDQTEIERVLSEPLPAYTEQSVLDPEVLRTMLAKVRADGYATNRCGYREGVSGIAAPIRDHTGRVVAAVGLCMPDYRFASDRFELFRDLTQRAGVDISRALGGPAAVVTSDDVPQLAD